MHAGSALDVLHEHTAELLYARIETPTRPEQHAYRTSYQASHVLSNRELAAETPLLSTPSPRALDIQRGHRCDIVDGRLAGMML